MPKGFQKGNKLGNGRPPKPSELKAMEKLDKQQIQIELSKVMRITPTELKRKLETPYEMTTLELACLRLMDRVIMQADYQCFNFFLDRIIGKAKETIEMDVTLAQREKAHDEIIDIVPREKIIEMVRLKTGSADE